jgi:acyl carrier protein
MTHVAPAAALKAPTLVALMLACGIRGDDAPALFERIFSTDARDLTVSSMSLPVLQRALQPALPRKPESRVMATPAVGDGRLSPVERAIAAVWGELLGTQEIDLQDDFFALGGHSLAAVRLFARIRKEFGVDLPLATLFKAPTLGGLSALVEQARSRAEGMAKKPNTKIATADPAGGTVFCGTDVEKKGADESSAWAEDEWSPLVEINRGRAGVKPLFCVHGAAGNVLNFKVIADRLGADQPFYALQAQGVDGRLPLLPTIEAMAAQYVAAIRT